MLEDIQALIDAIELRDIYTKGHSQRVAQYAKEFAKHLQFDQERQKDLYIAGILHDLGKVGIPDQVLLKPAQLDEEEYLLIQYHSKLSDQIVSKIPSYAYLAPIVRAHHENWDGSGYPDGLKGEEIPLEARILSLCDVFDALTTPRIYRQALSLEESLKILESQKNKFDPELFDKFIKFIKKRGIIKKDFSNLEKEILNKLRDNVFFHDFLTKTLNREGLLAVLRKSSDNPEFYGSLILINIKNFKIYNKHYGLKKGDILLKNVAFYLLNHFKSDTHNFFPKDESYYVARIKGDHFILFYIGHKVDFLDIKLKKMQQDILQKHHVEVEYKFLLEHGNLSKNIKSISHYI